MIHAGRAGLAAIGGGVCCQAFAMVLALLGHDRAMLTNWLAVAGVTATLAGALAMGAARRGALSRPARIALGTVVVVLIVGFGTALLLPDAGRDEPLWLGLPRRAAVVLLGVGFIPVLVLPACFALDQSGRDDGTAGQS